MAYKIGLISQKGGVWKSTLARALATAYPADWSVMIADLDTKQGTCTAWQQRRLAAGIQPTIQVQMFGSAAAALSKGDGLADVLIVDGRPTADRDTAVVARGVDMVILPTGLTLDDLVPTVTLANELADTHGVDPARVVFALIRATNETEIAEAREYLGKTRFATLAGSISLKPAYSRAMDSGRSLIETPSPAPRARAREVVSAAIKHLEHLINK